MHSYSIILLLAGIFSYKELRLEIERYIEYYNEQRIKEKLGWMKPYIIQD